MSNKIVMGTYVPNSSVFDTEIGGIPVPVIWLIGAAFVILIIVVSICIARNKNKKNSQSAPLQSAPVQPVQSAPVQPRPVQPVQSAPVQPQSVPVQPRPVQPVQSAPVQPQSVPVQPRPVQPVQSAPVQPQSVPVQPRPVQPVMVQQIQPAGAGSYGRNSNDDERTQFMVDDDRTQIMGEDDDATQMMPQEPVLYLTDINNTEKAFRMPLGNGIVIGRRAGEANLVLDYEKSISGRHCKVYERNGRYYVEDLQSANGTLVNGVRVQNETEMISGSILTLGRAEVRVEIRCE